MPTKTREYVGAELDKWAKHGVDGHFEEPLPWVSVDESVRDASARLVGAKPSEVVIMNSLTVNLHLMMVSFYRPDKATGKVKVLVEGKAFPSDMHMLQSQVLFHGLDPNEAIVKLEPREGEVTLRTEDVVATIEAQQGEIALVLMSGLQYYTGQAFDIKAITACARGCGLPVGWDLAHAVGNVPLNLHDDGPDFACWCTYKYLNSGPGNIAGCFVHERHGHHADLASLPRFAGWWGHRKEDRFVMDHTFIPSAGAQGFMVSNPPVLCCAALRASLDVYDAAGGVPALRGKSERLTGLLERLVDGLAAEDPRLAGQVTIFTPRDPKARGCQLSLSFACPGGVGPVFDKLTDKGVICDVHKPVVMRVAPTPLYNTYCDVFDFVQCLKATLLEILAEAAAPPLVVYYWPMAGRAGAVLRMLEHAKVPHEHRSDFPAIAAQSSAWAGGGDTFAPPIVVDGDVTVSQSVAACAYVGKKCGLAPDEEHKALQYMLDIVDTFETGGVAGAKDKGGAALKVFLEGERFAKQMGNLDRGIAGPFYFGAAPTSVDFFLCAHVDWVEATLFDRLKADKGIADPLAPFAKVKATVEGIRGLESYRVSALTTIKEGFECKDEIVAAYE